MRLMRRGERISTSQFLGRRFRAYKAALGIAALALPPLLVSRNNPLGDGLQNRLVLFTAVCSITFLAVAWSFNGKVSRFAQGREVVATVRLEIPPTFPELKPVTLSSRMNLGEVPILISTDGEALFLTNMIDGEKIQLNTLSVVYDSTSSGRVGSLRIDDNSLNSVRLPIITARRLPITGDTYN